MPLEVLERVVIMLSQEPPDYGIGFYDMIGTCGASKILVAHTLKVVLGYIFLAR
jgi:hypothetical protein